MWIPPPATQARAILFRESILALSASQTGHGTEVGHPQGV